MNKAAPAVLLAALTLTSTACSGASYNERMAYLRLIANRGVETHRLLASQGTTIDAKRCEAAYYALKTNPPDDIAGGGDSLEWKGQVRQFFVDSCVTGLPKPVPGQPAPSPASTSPTATPSPSKT